MWKLLHLKNFPENMISLQVFRHFKSNHGQKSVFAKIHAQTATRNYAAWRGDKKTDDGSNLYLQSCLQVLSYGCIGVSYQLQITTDCFYASFCLSLPAAPLSLPSSPSLHACLGTRTSCRRELPLALLLTTRAVSARIDGQLHKLPYSLAGESCQGHVGPLSTGDKKYITS